MMQIVHAIVYAYNIAGVTVPYRLSLEQLLALPEIFSTLQIKGNVSLCN